MVEQLTHLCQILNKHKVKYLIVGGAAVNIHGYIRLSRNSKNEETDRPDIDVWYEPNYENYLKNICDSLEDLGLDRSSYEKGVKKLKRVYISHPFEDYDLDFLPELKNFPKNLKQCYNKRRIAKILGIEIPLMSLEDLILSKESSSRPKDMRDVKELKKLLLS